MSNDKPAPRAYGVSENVTRVTLIALVGVLNGYC